MDLRSRSRSNTPLLRRSQRIIESTGMESRKFLRSQKKRYITSDYSSEEGEIVSDNTKNLIREELALSSTINGHGEVSALKLYKEAGEYWNKYPKTDYTYSKHSKDRVEIAPGVVVMPNMSRRSLHSSAECGGLVFDKETSTEDNSYFTTTNHRFDKTKLKPQVLFSNSNNNNNHHNNKNEAFTVHGFSKIKTFSRRFIFYFLRVLTILAFPVIYVYDNVQGIFLKIGKMLHRTASRMMLLDTWILQKRVDNERKFYGILGLCLLPLIVFGGFWVLYAIITGLTSWISTFSLNFNQLQQEQQQRSIIANLNQQTSDVLINPSLIPPSIDLNFNDKTRNLHRYDQEFIDKVNDFIDEMKTFKSSLSNLQTDVANNVLEMVSKQITSINKDKNKDDKDKNKDNKDKNKDKNEDNKDENKDIDKENKINVLIQEEIDNLKRGNFILQQQLTKMNQKVSYDVQKCCRKSLLEIEGYVQKVLNDFFDLNRDQSLNKEDLEAWLSTIFVAKNDLESKINDLTLDLKSDFDSALKHNVKVIMNDVSDKIKNEIVYDKRLPTLPTGNFIDEERIKEIISDSLSIYDADKTGLVDYAMESAGGHIISTRCTQIYHPKTAVLSVFGIPIWYPSNTPRTVITPGSNPGQCWAFQNFPGFLVIKLYGFVKISGFSMEHVSVKLAPNENIASAPKDFEVYGLKSENDLEATLLGKYQYLSNGKSLQFFPVDVGKVKENEVSFDLIELKVFSNHGNPNYTCLYRFRVHGELINELTT